MGDHSFSISVITPATVGAASAAAVIRPPASPGPGARPSIKRITVVVHNSPTSSSVVDVYRIPVANIGTPSVSTLGQGAVAADVSVTNVDTSWSGAPTLPGGAIRIDGVTLGGTIGSGAVINLPADFTLEPNTGLLLWCPSASAQIRITPQWTE